MEQRDNVIDRIVEHLENVRQRPLMFIGELYAEAIHTYLFAFTAGCRICGRDRPQDHYWKVYETRGWKMNSLGLYKSMRDAGMPEAAVVDELIVIEIEAWRQFGAEACQTYVTP